MLVRDFLDMVHKLAPWDLAADWDNSGLMIGASDRPVSSVGLALDATAATVRAALAAGCDLLLAHHPLIFKPLKKIDFSAETGRVVELAVQNGLTVVSAHTNWDSAARGVARALAAKLELTPLGPLEAGVRDFLKLTVFVPAGYEERVRRALFEAGAGQVGAYDRCWFAAGGEGGFRTPETGRPFLGRAGSETRTRESRLEVLAPPARAEAVASALRAAHPYEEPAFEFIPVKIHGPGQGLGLVGVWDPPRELGPQLDRLARAYRWAGLRRDRVGRVALLPGSGGDYLGLAKARGAEVFITGDVSYHLALEAEALGLCLVDLGHYETEWPSVAALAVELEAELDRAGQRLPLTVLDQAPVWNYRGILNYDGSA